MNCFWLRLLGILVVVMWAITFGLVGIFGHVITYLIAGEKLSERWSDWFYHQLDVIENTFCI